MVQVRLGCALVGHAGDRGTVPSPQDAQTFNGFLQPSSAREMNFVSQIRTKMGTIAPGGWHGYTRPQ